MSFPSISFFFKIVLFFLNCHLIVFVAYKLCIKVVLTKKLRTFFVFKKQTKTKHYRAQHLSDLNLFVKSLNSKPPGSRLFCSGSMTLPVWQHIR